MAADLATRRRRGALFARCEHEFGGLDIVVGNAGVWPPDEVPIGR
jgi:NAD(P)-dependent dehydrogenase (short-subunit alcohol dehydrogenase family)